MKYSLVIFTLLLFLAACKEEIHLTGDILVSDVQTKTDYYVPLILENDRNEEVILNGEKAKFENGILELTEAGFYEMVLPGNDTVLFVLLDEKRKETEWGLKTWIPKEAVYDTESNPDIQLIYPRQYVQGIAVPFVVIENGWDYLNVGYWQAGLSKGDGFNIKKGIGSGSVILNNDPNVEIVINGNKHALNVNAATSELLEINGLIDRDSVFTANSMVLVTGDLTIEEQGGLRFNEGCLVMVNEGVNINNSGSIRVEGTAENPVVFTSGSGQKYWGGFISTGSEATVNAKYAFFTRFGHHNSTGYQYGHAKRQALFKANATSLSFSNCWFMDSPGQVFYPENCTLSIDNCVVQRVKTSGQINYSTLQVSKSYFSDFPDDSQKYRDEDNDALYLNGTDATISRSVFIYTKDDGIDSGGGDGGEVTVRNCWIGTCFHEGLALSSSAPAVKTHRIENSIITNCQQGVELGFSSPNHTVYVQNCEIFGNYVGVRFGDNYTWGVNGIMHVTDCIIFDNDREIWNMVHQIWAPKPENLIVEH